MRRVCESQSAVVVFENSRVCSKIELCLLSNFMSHLFHDFAKSDDLSKAVGETHIFGFHTGERND